MFEARHLPGLIFRADRVDKTGMGIVDDRLLPMFEESWERERARRVHLPGDWLESEREPLEHLGDIFDDVLERARERVRAQRAALERSIHELDGGLDPAV
jgi:hypothetical protein